MPPKYWQVYCFLLRAITFHLGNWVLLDFMSPAFHIATLTFPLFMI